MVWNGCALPLDRAGGVSNRVGDATVGVLRGADGDDADFDNCAPQVGAIFASRVNQLRN
jgi:hypothetical protein